MTTSLVNGVARHTMVHHLICIVHGVGKHDSVKRTQRMEELARNKELVRKRVGADVEDFVFRFTEWHSEVQSTRDLIGEVSMPHGMAAIKSVLKDVVSDVLFYAEHGHRDRILASISAQINAFHAEFAATHPDSAENLHIIAHSLGGVVAYDLLCMHYARENAPSTPAPSCAVPPLVCQPKNLFICGSPLGLFLSIRGGGNGTDTSSMKPCAISPASGCLGATRCRNILHPLDVFAYRLEPLLFGDQLTLVSEDGSAASPVTARVQVGQDKLMQPVDVPYWKGRDHTHEKIKNIGKVLSSWNYRSGSGETGREFGGDEGGGSKSGKSPTLPGAGGFRQGLKNMLRMKRGEKGPGEEVKTVDGGLLLASISAPAQCSSPAAVEDEIAHRDVGEASADANGGSSHMISGSGSLQAVSPGAESTDTDGESEGCGGVRVDYKLQRTTAENLSGDFITSIRSHRAYWHSKDFLLFVLNCVAVGPPTHHSDCVIVGDGKHSASSPSTLHGGCGHSAGLSDDDNDDAGEHEDQDHESSW